MPIRYDDIDGDRFEFDAAATVAQAPAEERLVVDSDWAPNTEFETLELVDAGAGDDASGEIPTEHVTFDYQIIIWT